MYLIGNKAIRIGDAIVFGKEATTLELDVSGTSFPDTLIGSTYFRFSTTLDNEMYIDYNDGTGIHTYYNEANGSLGIVGGILHYFQDLNDASKIGTVNSNYNQRRKITVKFKYPNRINGILWQSWNLYGQFPEALGNFNITGTIRLSGMKKVDSFPLAFRGIKVGGVVIDNLTTELLNSVPSWITNSQINGSLSLVSVFNFKTNIPTHLDKLVNIIGLVGLTIDSIPETIIPDNFKNTGITRLQTNGSDWMRFPDNIGLMIKLQSLVISNSFGSKTFSNWGNGIGLLINLTTLFYNSIYTNTITSLPFGIENCWKIKLLECFGLFTTTMANDAHINEYYAMVSANGDKTTTSNNKFRQVSFRYVDPNGILSLRPSGVYQQPSGYVQGVTNGSPLSPMERIWVLVKQYSWTIRIRVATGNGIEILAP